MLLNTFSHKTVLSFLQNHGTQKSVQYFIESAVSTINFVNELTNILWDVPYLNKRRSHIIYSLIKTLISMINIDTFCKFKYLVQRKVVLWLTWSLWVWTFIGLILDRIQPDNITLVSPQRTHVNLGASVKRSWFGVKIMGQSWDTCLPADSCLSELVL